MSVDDCFNLIDMEVWVALVHEKEILNCVSIEKSQGKQANK